MYEQRVKESRVSVLRRKLGNEEYGKEEGQGPSRVPQFSKNIYNIMINFIPGYGEQVGKSP